METPEQDGLWPYRVIENDRITYFKDPLIAKSYLGITDGALETFYSTTFTWQNIAGKEHQYVQPIRRVHE
jgi:hypothetical protein